MFRAKQTPAHGIGSNRFRPFSRRPALGLRSVSLVLIEQLTHPLDDPRRTVEYEFLTLTADIHVDPWSLALPVLSGATVEPRRPHFPRESPVRHRFAGPGQHTVATVSGTMEHAGTVNADVGAINAEPWGRDVNGVVRRP